MPALDYARPRGAAGEATDYLFALDGTGDAISFILANASEDDFMKHAAG